MSVAWKGLKPKSPKTPAPWLRWLGLGVLVVGAVGVAGCATSKRDPAIQPVQNFVAEKYMGQWHEIARIDHRFQRGLIKSSAHYSLNSDGTVKVVNRGFDPKKQAWKDIEGKAKFAQAPTVGALRVSFFGPFYSGYNVVSLDPDYRVAMVLGDTPEYFWILARDPQIPDAKLKELLEHAKTLGVDVSQVIQDPRP